MARSVGLVVLVVSAALSACSRPSQEAAPPAEASTPPADYSTFQGLFVQAAIDRATGDKPGSLVSDLTYARDPNHPVVCGVLRRNGAPALRFIYDPERFGTVPLDGPEPYWAPDCQRDAVPVAAK